MADNDKPKLAMYWASSCGGCEIATLNIHEHILTVDAVFDLAFFPCVADFKVNDESDVIIVGEAGSAWYSTEEGLLGQLDIYSALQQLISQYFVFN